MTAGRHSRNYAGGVFLTQDRIKINTQVARFPLSWQGRLRRALGAMKTWADLDRWSEKVAKLTEVERGGLRPDASDDEICHQADLTARDMADRLRDFEAVWLGRKMLRAGVGQWCGQAVVRLGEKVSRWSADFLDAMRALVVREVLDARGLADMWPGGLSSDPRHCGWTKPGQRAAWIKRAMCPRFWRRVYRKLHARTVEAVAVEIGLVRKTRGLYCSDDAVKRSHAQDVRNVAVLESVHAANDLGQAYRLADLAAKGVANQEIRRHELLTRIAGFELIAKDCSHFAVMVTATCPSRFHAATTRGDGRVIDNPKYQQLSPRDGQDYLAKQWARCRAAAARMGLEWYGFRIAEPQHDGTPHWHILLFMPHGADGVDSLVLLQTLVRRYFLENDSPDEPGARKYRVDFELIDWARGSAVGYVIKYISKNIDGHGVGVDLFGNDAVTSSQRVRAWARTWRIRQFQQVGGAPVGVWRELRRVHPENVPSAAPEALREAISAMNVAKVEPGVQSLAWAKYTRAQGGVNTCRAALRIKLIKEVTGTKTRYGEQAPDRTVGVWSEGVELFVPAHMAHMKHAAPLERSAVLEVESERAKWLMGGTSKAAALAVAAEVFKRSAEGASTRIHVNNCTGPRDWNAPPPSMFAPVRRRMHKLRRFGWHETGQADPGNQLE